jgi:hypothetical protein
LSRCFVTAVMVMSCHRLVTVSDQGKFIINLVVVTACHSCHMIV